MTITALGLSATRSGRTILHPTDVDIKPGERVGLVGASGSGKSTLGHELIDTLRAKGQNVAHVPQSPDEALDPLRSMAFHWKEAEQALGLFPNAARQQALFSALRIEGGNFDHPSTCCCEGENKSTKLEELPLRIQRPRISISRDYRRHHRGPIGDRRRGGRRARISMFFMKWMNVCIL